RIDFDEALHLPPAGFEVVLEHGDRFVDLLLVAAIASQRTRPRQHPHAMHSMFDVELVENPGHARASSVLSRYTHKRRRKAASSIAGEDEFASGAILLRRHPAVAIGIGDLAEGVGGGLGLFRLQE